MGLHISPDLTNTNIKSAPPPPRLKLVCNVNKYTRNEGTECTKVTLYYKFIND